MEYFDADDGSDGTPSPLLNHVVMEKVLSYLEFPDWKSCRLVCSFWNEVSLKNKLNKAALICLEDTSLERFLNNLVQQQQTENSLPSPEYENFSLKVNSLLSQNEKMDTLWNEAGNKIKYLRMELTTLYALRKLQDILTKTDSLEEIRVIVTEYWGSCKPQFNHVKDRSFWNSSKSPLPNFNLKSFSYSYLGSLSLYGMGNQEEFSFPMDWMNLFQRFPLLKKLRLVGLSELELTQMLTALQAIRQNTSSSSCLALEELELLDENMCPEAPNNAHLHILSVLNLPLKQLHLEISPLLSVALLNSLLLNLSSTLTSLRLRRFPLVFLADERITLRVPLQNVKLLEISTDLVTSLEFLPYFSQLETLNIILRDYRSLPSCEMIINTPATTDPHPNLRNLYIEPPLASEDCIIVLGRLFPKLKRLKIRLDDEMLWALCGSQPMSQVLEELHIISYGGLTDEGFTGISEDGWNHLVRAGMGHNNDEDVHQFRIYPYIGDLINLIKLTVEMWSDYTNHISDHTIHYGIMELRRLKEFHGIRVPISKRTIQLLEKHVERCIVEE